MLAVYFFLNWNDYRSIKFAGKNCTNVPDSELSNKMSGVKVLYIKAGVLYAQKACKIAISKDAGKSFQTLADIPYPYPFRLLKYFAFLRRIARMDIIRTCVTSNGNVVFNTKGGVYCLKNGDKHAHLVLPTPRPISLGYKPNGIILVGEYILDKSGRAVKIFGSTDEGLTWKPVYTFPPKAIRHVHYIDYDKYDDCFWVSTGDSNDESRFIKFSADLKESEIVLKGSQQVRFFETRAFRDCVFAVTDTGAPNANFIRRIDKKTGTVENIAAVQNPLYFTAAVGDYFIAATACQPSSYESNDVQNVHVWAVNTKNSKARHVGSFGVDLPTKFSYCKYSRKGLFQYANAAFPSGDPMEANRVMISGTGLPALGYSTYIWDLSKKLDF